MKHAPNVDFKQVLSEAGLPMTAEAITTELETAVKGAGSQIANDRTMSPFWRLIKAVVVTPVLWLINSLVAGHVLPAMFVSTARGVYLELKGQDMQITRLPAIALQGNLTATKTDPQAALTLPVDTVIQTLPLDGKVLSVKITETCVIPAGIASAQVKCEATEPGTAHNLPAGYFNRLLTPIDGLSSIRNEPDWIIHPGQDRETDDALALRIRNRYGAAGHYHIDAVYRDLIAKAAGIRVDYMVFEHDAPRGPGTANCYIFMPVGRVPSSLLQTVNDFIAAGHHGHGDDMQVMAMPSESHTITCHYWPHATATEQDKANLQTAITQRIQAAFRQSAAFPNITRVWPMSTFSISVLITELHNELPALGGLRIEQTDIVSARSLPTLSQLTVTEASHATL